MMPSIKTILGSRVALWRGRRGVTQADLGEAVGVARGTIVRIENGEQWPEYATVVALCSALGIEETDLLQDPDLTRPTLEQAKAMILEALDQPKATSLSPSSLVQKPSESQRSGRK